MKDALFTLFKVFAGKLNNLSKDLRIEVYYLEMKFNNKK